MFTSIKHLFGASARSAAVVLLSGVLLGGGDSPLTAQAQSGCPTATDTRRGTVTGVVTDPSGARVSHAEIVFECAAYRQEVTAESDGSFRASVPPGTLHVKVTASGFSASSQEVVVAADAEAAVTFSLALAQVTNVVDVTADTGYSATETVSGTKTSTPLLLVPQAITVVTRQLLDDQGAIKLDDALKNVAGVKPGGYYQHWDYYHIRGFDASFTTYIDGLRIHNGIGEETFGLERVEILKGPSSAVYGQGTLGGIVNLQSKRPRPETFGEIELTAGSYGIVSPAVDLGFKLNESGTLYGRVNALYRHQDSFVDFVNKDRTFIAPSLTWDIGPATQLTILTRYQHDDNLNAFPLPAAGFILPNINGELPISRYTGEPDSNKINIWNAHSGYAFTHHFNDNFTFRQNLDASWYHQDWDKVYYSGFLAADQRTLYRYPYNYDNDWHTFTVDSSLQSDFKIGSLGHSLLSGVEYYHYGDDYSSQTIDFSPSSYIPIDLYAPVYTNPTPTFAPLFDGPKGRANSTGLYLQDQVKLLNNLRLTAGARYETSNSGNDADPIDQKTHAVTPRIGLSYEFVPGAVVYASYSRSFNPQYGRAFDGSSAGAFVDPERGEQYEAGLKTAVLDGRVSSTFAIFQLTRSNVATSDPFHPGFSLITGKQRSRGVEVETALRLVRGWMLTSAYTYTDAEVTEDNTIPIGTRAQNVPKHSYSAFTTYELPARWVEGLGVGLGGNYYTDQGGDLFDTFSLPDYGVVDASVYYRRGRFRAQVNLYNALDRRYASGSYNDLYVQPGDLRTVRATVGWRF